jgi:OOP family OmpA-OmpF porin
MFKKTMTVAAMAAAGLVFSASASAQVYVGASVGEANWNVDCSGTSSCKNNDTAYKVFGGYKFTPQWAVEVSYFDLGHATATVDGVGVKSSATGGDVSAVYTAQLSKQWNLFYKLGVAEVNGKITGSLDGFSVSDSKNTVQPVVGFGVNYLITPTVGIRADIDTRRVEVASGSGSSGNVTNFEIGLQAAF